MSASSQFIILVIVICPFSTVSTVVKSGDDLVSKLCNFKGEMLTLDHSHEYKITKNKTCVVNTNGAITITSNSTHRATVSCVHQAPVNPVPTVAFGFIDTKVLISRINFVGCGALLKGFTTSFKKQMNSSQLPFTDYQSALFVFINSTVNMTDVNITYYYGFAIIGINLQNSSFFNLTIAHSIGIELISKGEKSIGSGVVIFFFSPLRKHAPPVTVVQFRLCLFYINFEYDRKDNRSCVASRFINGHEHPGMFNAAGLTVIFFQEHREIRVTVLNSKFEKNFGTHAGAVMVLMINTTEAYVRIDQNSYFKSNYNLLPCPGSAIYFYMENNGSSSGDLQRTEVPLRIMNTMFTKHDGVTGNDLDLKLFRYGVVFFGVKHPSVSMKLKVINTTFSQNIAEEYSSCLFSTVYGFPKPTSNLVSMSLHNVQAYDNSQVSKGHYVFADTGLFLFTNCHSVTLSGFSVFSNNIGSVIKSSNSPVNLTGRLMFSNNRAISGAAISIKYSILLFHNGLNLKIHQNFAKEFGGAIYIDNPVYTPLPLCALQFVSNDSINFNSCNNTANYGGNIIHAFPIYNCYQEYLGIQVHTTQFYEDQIRAQHEDSRANNLLEISSKVYNLSDCGSYNHDQLHYPGETIKIDVSARDESINHVYALVHVQIVENGNQTVFKPHRSSIKLSQEIQVIEENKYGNTCSTINVIIRYYDQQMEYRKVYFVLEPKGDHNFKPLFYILHLSMCPLGFALVKGTCQCGRAVQMYYDDHNFNGKCDIDTLSIQKPNIMFNPWLGHLKNETEFGLSHSCPIEVCSSNLQYSFFRYDTSSNSYMLVHPNGSTQMPLCRENRVGVMCGECNKNYSVVFGSGECRKCSNWYLLTSLFYGISGLLLIYFLHFFKLTLTAGTLNGIIFYAQAANVGILQALLLFEREQFVFSKILSIFLSLLNLNLGFPLCFFNGMTELWKTGLSLVFPVYLLTITLVLIVLGRYSSRLSNRIAHSSVQVFVTLLHLSVSRLLIVVIDVFTPAALYKDGLNASELVWYRSGAISFSYNEHSLLVLMFLTIIVGGTFFFLYFLFFIGGRCFIKSQLGDKYFRFTYESIHGPYRDNRKYWFSSRFILLLSMYIIYAVLRGQGIAIVCIATLPLLIVFLAIQVYLRPFKSKLINLIDTAVMLDLVLIYVIGWYIMAFNVSISKIQQSITIIIVLTFLIIVLFICIIVYHISLVTGCIERVKLAIKCKRHGSSVLFKQESNTPLLSHESYNSFNASNANFREPIMEHL